MEAGASGREAILLVEDDPIVALAARHALEDMGFHVTTAPHGAAALHHVRSAHSASSSSALAAPCPAGAAPETPQHCGPFMLAIVDVGLPDMSGTKVVQALRDLAPTLPIIIASGHAWAELEEEFSNLSAIFRLDKPYSGASLRNALCSMGIQPPHPEA
ncbi:response regulator [Xanthobacter sp. TB0139]|uniref:response regulator n=1 Tax=Xanthobacter sp. TB0139 TaxID=3459178 RepID=UPI004039A041